jgi:type I restriction enzyme S subunit
MVLPKGWVETKLCETVDILDAYRKPINNAERTKRIAGKKDTELYPYYGATGLAGQIDGYLLDGEYVLLGEDAAPFLSTTEAKAYIVSGRIWVNNHAHILFSYTSNKFLCYYLNQFKYKEYITGTTRYKLPQGSMIRIPIPLPPLAEQHRIVAKVDALFSELDKGVDCLQAIKAQLKTYRQAVLKWAFEGKYEYQLFGNIVTSRLGKMLDKNKNRGTNKPYIRNINVRWFEFDLSDLLQMRFEENENDQFDIIKGDLVICEGGEPGRCAIWKSDDSIKYQKALHRVRPNENVSSEYLMYYIRHIIDTGKINQYFTGTGIKHLTGESLRRIPVPVQEISKQHEIVAAIESRLSVCDKLEKLVDENIIKSEALRQSILKKAFEGRLVPQDPSDESAEKLLERIKAERNSHQKPVKSTASRSKKNGRK